MGMKKKHDAYQSRLWKEQMKEDKRGYVHPLKEEK
jgi:hypothetical protein